MSSESNRRSRRHFPSEFKQEAVRMMTEGGVGVGQASRDLDIDEATLRRWKRQAESQPDRFDPQRGPTLEEELQQLRRENARLKMERDILKKATAFFASESK